MLSVSPSPAASQAVLPSVLILPMSMVERWALLDAGRLEDGEIRKGQLMLSDHDW